jgi:RNA polymerase sigma factor (sigma-70 family)
VAKQMPGFRYDPAVGSFKAWLLQITRRRIVDQLRKRAPAGQSSLAHANARASSSPRQNGDADRTATVERIPDPDADVLASRWETDWQRNLLEAALTRVKRRVSPKQFQMFDLYVSQQWPMELVKTTLGVNAAQVYMAKMRISKLIKREVRVLEARGI